MRQVWKLVVAGLEGEVRTRYRMILKSSKLVHVLASLSSAFIASLPCAAEGRNVPNTDTLYEVATVVRSIFLACAVDAASPSVTTSPLVVAGPRVTADAAC